MHFFDSVVSKKKNFFVEFLEKMSSQESPRSTEIHGLSLTGFKLFESFKQDKTKLTGHFSLI